jgi:hypothetical protein
VDGLLGYLFRRTKAEKEFQHAKPYIDDTDADAQYLEWV